MAIRDIKQNKDSCLYQKCRPVTTITGHIRDILSDMADTLAHANHGGGLAANQVGILRRLVVINVNGRIQKLVNPEILSHDGTQYVTEGCLSFPDVWGKVHRPQELTVRALDENGKPVKFHAQGLLAQCLSHEIDHLDGVIFVNKIEEFVTD